MKNIKKGVFILVFMALTVSGVFAQNRQQLGRALEEYVERLYFAGDFVRIPIRLDMLLNQEWSSSILIFPIRPEARDLANNINRLLVDRQRFEIMPRFNRGEGVMGLNEFQIVTIVIEKNIIILLGTGMI